MIAEEIEMPTADGQLPRERRVPVEETVFHIEGTRGDGGGRFEGRARVTVVSSRGATLQTDAPVAQGMRVLLIPDVGPPKEGEVNAVWSDREDGHQRCGVRLIDPAGWVGDLVAEVGLRP